MERPGILLLILLGSTLSLVAQQNGPHDRFGARPRDSADICVYGATSAGVIAACAAKRAGKTVILLEPGNRVGGLSTGGLGYTDIGNKYAISGMARDFYRRVGARYGRFESWVFEPHVALEVFQSYLKEAGIEVRYRRRLVAVKKEGNRIQSITTEDARDPGAANTQGTAANIQHIIAKQFIDCSYEGDLMAKAGVRYFVGREANCVYNETYDGAQLRDKHQFPDGVDPYRTPRDPASGLLWGIDHDAADSAGTGDQRVQSYNFRICLTNDPANRLPITQPAGYNPDHYTLLLRLLEKRPAKDLNSIMKIDHMPNHKTDINNNGGFSTDMIGANYAYPDGDFAAREAIRQAHLNYTKGFLYFIGHDPRMPESLRNEMGQWGYPKDEYPENDHWTPQLYVREARRMIGAYVMTQADCEGRATVDDGIGLAAYTMDSHNCRRLVINGMVKNEGDVQIGGFGPYPVSYRAIVPKKEECSNLLVPVCLSASHIAYGSIRMEPVFMVLGQSAAIAAAEAVDAHSAVQDIDVDQLQEQLRTNPLADGSTPEILLHIAEQKGEASLLFRPAIVKTGVYKIYLYQPGSSKDSTAFSVVVNGVAKILHPAIDPTEQQASGEWVPVGRYTLTKENDNTVTITSTVARESVAVDAVLFVPDFK